MGFAGRGVLRERGTLRLSDVIGGGAVAAAPSTRPGARDQEACPGSGSAGRRTGRDGFKKAPWRRRRGLQNGLAVLRVDRRRVPRVKPVLSLDLLLSERARVERCGPVRRPLRGPSAVPG